MDFLNPFKYFTPEQYNNFWHGLFSTILVGFWGRFFAGLFLVLAFWFGVIRQRAMAGFFFFGLTVVITFFASIGKTFFWWVF